MTHLNRNLQLSLKTILSTVLILAAAAKVYQGVYHEPWNNINSLWFIIPLPDGIVTLLFFLICLAELTCAVFLWIEAQQIFKYALKGVIVLFSFGVLVSVLAIIRDLNSSCGFDLLGANPYSLLFQKILLVCFSAYLIIRENKNFTSFKIFVT